MKHFQVQSSPVRELVRQSNVEDVETMADEGFKKFRRRKTQERLDKAKENGQQDNLNTLLEERPADLPARLPELWDLLRQTSFDDQENPASTLPLVNYFRQSPTARAFDLLRTRLMQTLKARGWKRVAITAPTSGCGVTFCAVNLALSLARVPGNRTLLLDMNFRRPGVAQALGLDMSGNMAAFLAGERSLERHLLRLGDNLAVGLNRVPQQDAAEILHDERCSDALEDMIVRTGAGTVLYDLPPVLNHDDVVAFVPQVDGVLLISDGTETTASQLEDCEKMLSGHVPLLGVVLNKAQRAA